jgi:hypothetical protein
VAPHLENCAPELGHLVETGLSDNFSTTSSQHLFSRCGFRQTRLPLQLAVSLFFFVLTAFLSLFLEFMSDLCLPTLKIPLL